MIAVALSCFAAALAIALVAPAVFTVGRWQLLHPGWALNLWFGAFFGSLALVAAGMIAGIAAGLDEAALQDPAERIVLRFATWVGLAVLGAAIGFVLVAAEPLVSYQRAAVADLADSVVSRVDSEGVAIVRFAEVAPQAFAVPGRHPSIYVSTGAVDLLTEPQLRAVIAHERAHLRGRHGWALRIADLNAALFGPLPAGRALRRATRLLVELAADDAAARQAGAANLANALARMGEAVGDASLRLRADRLTEKRWPVGAGRTRGRG